MCSASGFFSVLITSLVFNCLLLHGNWPTTGLDASLGHRSRSRGGVVAAVRIDITRNRSFQLNGKKVSGLEKYAVQVLQLMI